MGRDLHRGDRDLVRRLLRGDPDAFDRFSDEQLPRLYRFAARRVRDPARAMDLAQTTLATGFSKLEDYRGESSLSTWLCGICRFHLSNLLRSERRAPRSVSLDESAEDGSGLLERLTSPDSSPLDDLERGEVASRVHEVLDQLPDRYGRALEWKYVEGLSVRDIAERLELGPKAAESLLTRARNAFRDAFAAPDPPSLAFCGDAS